MMRIREEVEHEIWWQQKGGTASFWMDNWTKLGALYFIEPQGLNEEVEVKDMIQNEEWDIPRLRQMISEDMVNYIVENINPIMEGDDKAWWMGNTQGEFTVKSAFQLLRRRREEQDWMNNIWIKGLPFKISFFLWRVWRKRIPTDDVLKKMKINMVSKCYCCNVGEEETIQHLFLTAPIAQQLWNHFASCAGINIEGLHLQQLITTWWDWPAKHKVKQMLNAMPAIIMWEL
uniref:RNase H family protein n=1 Tax=Solanum tuberosum TaxID=4113 RepID=M1BXK5_SOLTU